MRAGVAAEALGVRRSFRGSSAQLSSASISARSWRGASGATLRETGAGGQPACRSVRGD